MPASVRPPSRRTKTILMRLLYACPEGRLPQRTGLHDLEIGTYSAGGAARDDGAAKSKLRRLSQAQLHLDDASQLPRQAHLADHDGVRVERCILERRQHRQGRAQIRRRLLDAQPADPVDVDVEVVKR